MRETISASKDGRLARRWLQSRRWWGGALLLVCALASVAGGGAQRAAAQGSEQRLARSSAAGQYGAKNVLLILADDMSAHLGALGTEAVTTPVLDSLAAQGVLFTKAHAASASCSPSRGSILTGMYPHSNGHWRNTITPKITDPASEFGRQSSTADRVGVHEDIATLPEILKQAGFYTGITQKWHLSPPWKFPFQRRLPAKGSLENIRRDVNTFLQEAGDRPFFLQMNIGNTHRRFDASFEGVPRVAPEDVDMPPLFPDTPKARQDLAAYFSSINALDAAVGATLDALKASGRSDETLVIFTSDHGWAYPRGKATAYYMGTHVPLIVSGPGVVRNRRTDALTSLVDLMPTMLDALDLEAPETVQGRSLRAWLTGETPSSWRDVLFTEHNSHGPPERDWYPSRSALDGRYHYILNLWPDKTYRFPADLTEEEGWGTLIYDAVVEARGEAPEPYEALQNTIHRPKEELYNIEQDPYELNNLADDPAYAEEQQRLKTALQQWITRTDDPFDPAQIERRSKQPAPSEDRR